MSLSVQPPACMPFDIDLYSLAVSVTNNYALNFNIPMPLHMIFRAGSLLANMIMGFVLLGNTLTSYFNKTFRDGI